MPPSRDRFVAAVEAVYGAAGAVNLWPAALDRIAECFDAVGTVLMYRQQDGSMATIVSPALVEAGRAYEAGGWKLDFTVSRAVEASLLAPQACYSDRNLATEEEITAHPFFTEFRAQHGLGPFLGGIVSPHPHLQVIITMQGGLNRAAFTSDDLNEFAKLARHVEKALILTMRLVEAELSTLTLADALSRLSCGVFLLDAAGRVTFSNDAAQRLVGDALSMESGQLEVKGPGRDAFKAALAKIGDHQWSDDSENRHPLLIQATTGPGAVVLYVLPVVRVPTTEGGDFFAANRALVIALDYDNTSRADPAVVRDLLGLSLGEARVASLVGAGQSPREAAQELNITEESARTILKRVFQKVGVSKQSELSLMLSRLTLRG